MRVLLERSDDGGAINDNDGFCLSARASKALSISTVFKGGFSLGSGSSDVNVQFRNWHASELEDDEVLLLDLLDKAEHDADEEVVEVADEEDRDNPG